MRTILSALMLASLCGLPLGAFTAESSTLDATSPASSETTAMKHDLDSVQQAAHLTARFHAGQTFLNWRQPAVEGIRFRIYRSLKPFEAEGDLTDENLLATVNDVTSLNWMASIERPGGEYRLARDERFVIEDGGAPLDKQTGLFVYTAREEQRAFYAVTAVVDGIENRSIIGGADGNALMEAIDERIEMPQPVRQNDLDYVHWTDNRGTDLYPAMSSMPSIPYIFRVKTPDPASAAQDSAPALIGVLHGATQQYSTRDKQRQQQKLPPVRDDKAVRVQFDSPYMKIADFTPEPFQPGGWYGYNENVSTGKPMESGQVRDYHVQRVLWTLGWVESTFKTDPQRVSLEGISLGGCGVMIIGLLHPERFAAIVSLVPLLRRPETSTVENFPKPILLPVVPSDYIAMHPEIDFPFIIVTAGRTDTTNYFKDKVEFARAAEETNTGFILNWQPGGHGGQLPKEFAQSKPVTPQVPPVPDLSEFRLDQSYPAISHCTANNDPGTVHLDVPERDRPPLNSEGVGDLSGTMNGHVTWERDTIVDETARYEITLQLQDLESPASAKADVTPRRTQHFRPRPSEGVRYELHDVETNETVQTGTVQADDYGHVTVSGVLLTSGGTRLILALDRPEK